MASFRVGRVGSGGREQALVWDRPSGQRGRLLIAAAIAAEIGRTVAYRPVATDGAARAASLIAELV